MNNYKIFNLATQCWLHMQADSERQALSNAYEYVQGNFNTWEYQERFADNLPNMKETREAIYIGSLGILKRERNDE